MSKMGATVVVVISSFSACMCALACLHCSSARGHSCHASRVACIFILARQRAKCVTCVTCVHARVVCMRELCACASCVHARFVCRPSISDRRTLRLITIPSQQASHVHDTREKNVYSSTIKHNNLCLASCPRPVRVLSARGVLLVSTARVPCQGQSRVGQSSDAFASRRRAGRACLFLRRSSEHKR